MSCTNMYIHSLFTAGITPLNTALTPKIKHLKEGKINKKLKN